MLGGFESLSRVIGGIMDVVGIPGFLENLDDHSRSADADVPFMAFVAAWWERYQSKPVTAGRELIDLAQELDLGTSSDVLRRIRLGKLLPKNRDRPFGDLHIEALGPRRGAQQWRLVRVED
jgi:putative DNA primase/helicase